jgi:integrase
MQLTNQDIEVVTNGFHKYIHKQFTEMISRENAVKIAKYIQDHKSENLSDGYRRMTVTCLITLSRYFKNKSFSQLTKSDIMNYLDSLRKTEDADPAHKWIGTYNVRRQLFLKFFKWLYYPSEEAIKRPIPEVMRGVSSLKRKEQSIYKPDDLWSPEDDSIFLKYCPDKRIQCYHTVARDTSARPSEILKLRVREINFKRAGDKTYAEISVNGKTGSRIIPLFSSIPFIKDWLNNHPQPGNSNAYLIPSKNRAAFCRKIAEVSLNRIYHGYKTKMFPSLLSDENVPLEDKNKIEQLLKKPWNPYVRRHTGLTEKSKMKQLNEYQLRQYAGWSARSQMALKYIHYFGNEASESILEAYGVITKNKEQADTLRYKQCPNCSEPNKPDNRFCDKCRMTLTYDAYSETLEKEQKRESEIQNLKDRYEQDMKSMRGLLDRLLHLVDYIKTNGALEVKRSE